MEGLNTSKITTRKRNEFLEDSGSEDEVELRDDNSEIDDVRKGSRSSKRRKTDSDISDDEDDQISHDDSHTLEAAETTDLVVGTDAQVEGDKPRKRKPADLPDISRPLTKKNLVATAASIKRSGVVYLSRIPPFMKPTKLRSLLSPYGMINRIFLTPEDPASYARRVRGNGNKKRSFVDGWVEFVNKADAKQACELLNAQIIGGKKGTYYYDDVWNLLYLKGFKWHNLTEQIAAENAERASRMRAEISKTTKENKEFVQNVERAKMLEGIESKKAAKRREEHTLGSSGTAGAKVKLQLKSSERPRTFKQTAVAPKGLARDQNEQIKRVLSKIF